MEFRWISGSGGLGGSYWAGSQKMPSSRKCSHRNSVQNGPIDSFTALTGTVFVAISVFMSPGHFPTTFGQLLDNFGQLGGQVTLRSGLEAQGSGRYAIRSFMLPDQTLRPSA